MGKEPADKKGCLSCRKIIEDHRSKHHAVIEKKDERSNAEGESKRQTRDGNPGIVRHEIPGKGEFSLCEVFVHPPLFLGDPFRRASEEMLEGEKDLLVGTVQMQGNGAEHGSQQRHRRGKGKGPDMAAECGGKSPEKP